MLQKVISFFEMNALKIVFELNILIHKMFVKNSNNFEFVFKS